jgi:cation-transporting P-type ATPase E
VGHETPPSGLTAFEVAERVARGATNVADDRTSRTVGEIVRANVLTRFNAILGSLLVVILVVGPIQDALFGIVLVANALIGVVQEWRSKRTLDRLAVLNAPTARVRRDDALVEIDMAEIVIDDLLALRAGDQVPADGIVRSTDGLELDESLLTGESDPIAKQIGDECLSGSIVVAGTGDIVISAVGADSYARRLATEARRFSLVHSEIQAGINLILRYVTWALAPTALVLALSQFAADHESWREAVAGTVAGVVAMVPEGLVLLTSLAFAVAAVTLARRQVLVQELPAVEGLARVDVFCVDKTGTITEGAIEFAEVELFLTAVEVDQALGALAADENANATMAALRRVFLAPETWSRTGVVPFSSARKWSAASFADHGSWVIGAPEMMLADDDDRVRTRANEHAALGRRVLLLARSDAMLDGEALPESLVPAALVLFDEKVRGDAAATFAYFTEQGVALKVISGDNPATVGAVAARAEVPGADAIFDARHLPTDERELADVLESHTVFGRVTPQQKRDMVKALQARGHTVAMTGDGVNDALALKDADIGIAMGSGAPATRAVAQLVLLDGKFATMPGVVAEGRRVIANIERVANLFVTKTVYAMLLALATGVARWPYPFLPRHMTVVSTLSIGVPAFFLALAPNSNRYTPGFVPRILRFAIPAGLVAACATFGAYAACRSIADVELDQARTAATLVLLAVGLHVLALLARPITGYRAALVAAMTATFVLAIAVDPIADFYALHLPPSDAAALCGLVAAIAISLLELGWVVAQRRRPSDQRVARFATRPIRSSRDV